MLEKKRVWEVKVGECNGAFCAIKKVAAENFEDAAAVAVSLLPDFHKKSAEKGEILSVKYAGEVYV